MRTSLYNLIIDGKPALPLVHERLLTLEACDYSGEMVDLLTLTFDDRPHPGTRHNLAVPKPGSVIEAALSFDNTLVNLGQYILEDYRLSSPPAVLTLQAKGLSSQSLLSAKNTLWGGDDNKLTLGSIINQIAQNNGLKACVDQTLANITVPSIIQTAESDLHFLARLAQRYGAVFKSRGKSLIFALPGNGQSTSGHPLSPLTLTLDAILGWRATFSERNRYTGVKAQWYDLRTAEWKAAQAGTDTKLFYLRHVYSDAATAQRAANATLKALIRSTSHLCCQLKGNPYILAESPLILKNIRSEVDGDWVVSSAIHKLDSRSYTSTIEAYRP